MLYTGLGCREDKMNGDMSETGPLTQPSLLKCTHLLYTEPGSMNQGPSLSAQIRRSSLGSKAEAFLIIPCLVFQTGVAGN